MVVLGTVESIEFGLWFVVVGYYWLLFGYYLIFRYPENKNTFNLAIALFFLSLAIGRGFYIVFDFYAPDILWWKMGTFFQWAGLSCVSAAIAIKLFARKIIQYPFILIPIILGCTIFLVPSEHIDTLRLLLIYIFAPIYAILIPIFFFLIAWRIAGKIRIGALLCGIGFLILYAGRTLHATLIKPWLGTVVGLEALVCLLPPSLVIIALFFIVSGSQILGK